MINIIFIQITLTPGELQQLEKEFPQYRFLMDPTPFTSEEIRNKWPAVEIIFGDHFGSQELKEAVELRWIHTPHETLNRICVKEIRKKKNILLSNTLEENKIQVSEYVMAGVLAFAKNLFHFRNADHMPELLWDSKWRNQMETLNGKIFLQIGMGAGATEIARQAESFGMQVIGVSKEKSFHPHFKKIYSMNQLPELLPKADVINVMLPRTAEYEHFLNKEAFELIKTGALLSLIGNHAFDEEALVESGTKFKGIILDAYYQKSISQMSKLWTLPNILITPEVSPRPKALEKEGLKVFKYNLRQYIRGNYAEMKNLVDTSVEIEEEWALT